MKPIIRILLASVAFALVACGSSVEGQQESWKKSQEVIVLRSEMWPAFKPYLDARLEQAKTAWDEASKVSGEEEKIEALKQANAILDPLLKDLNAVDAGMSGLGDAINHLRELRLAGTDDARRIEAVAAGNAAYRDVSKGMSDARPADDASAVKIASTMADKATAARSKAEDALKSLKPDTKKPATKPGKKT